MRKPNRFLLLAVMTLLAAGAWAEERSARTRRSAPKRIAYRAELPPLPRALAFEAQVETQRAPAVHVDDRRRIVAEAKQAAHWAAAELVRRDGLRETFRVGFFEGQRAAWDDPWLGAAEFEAGLRDGRRDADARAVGRDLGREEAARIAAQLAADEASHQFRDLGREPQADVLLAPPTLEAVGPKFPAPGLRAIIEAQSFSQLRLEPRWANYLRGWDVSPWQLHGCPAYTDFYMADWDSVANGLALLQLDRRGSRFFRAYGVSERAAFEWHFARELRHRLAARFLTQIEDAYEQGFLEGWSWGAWLREEDSYERGYSDGAEQAARRAAGRTFERNWDVEFQRAYAVQFARWMNQPHLELSTVRVVDLDRDDVVAPGDDIEVSVEWINFGGVGFEGPLELIGRDLERGERLPVVLPARRRSEVPLTAIAAVRESTPNGSQARLEVRLGETRERIEIPVRTPLQLVGATLLERDALAGDVRVEVAMRNISTRPRTGLILASARHGDDAQRELGMIDAEDTVTMQLALSGIDPLAMIAGDVRVELRLQGENPAVGAERTLRVGGTNRQLANDELEQWLILQGSDPEISPARVRKAKQLMLERMRVDWKRAVRARGNPYKRDYRDGSQRTIVGTWLDLQATQPESHPVLSGFGRDLDLLADELPGPHPFLRKYLRRLAKRFG